MSQIKAELVKVTELSTKRGEDHQEFLTRLVKATAELSDKEWDGLSKEAQDWYNDAADAKNAKAKTLPDFPDYPKDEEEEEAPKTRRGSKAGKEEAAPAKPKVGMAAKVVTKRGKELTGHIVEIDDEVLVLKLGNGEEEELSRDRLESITVLTEGKVKAAEPEETDPIKVGATVKLTTKRGKEVTGKIVELDDDVVVLDVDGNDEEFSRDRVEGMVIVGGKSKGKAVDADTEEKAPKTRRGSKADADEAEEAGDSKPKRSSNAGVSVGQRIREIMCDDLSVTEEEVSKQMKKEGLEFRDTSLKMIFKDTTAVFSLLKAAKKLK